MLRNRLGFAALLLLAASACFAKPQEEVVMSPPRPAGSAEVTHERQSKGVEMTAAATEMGIDVAVVEKFECRDVTSAPMTQTVHTRQLAPVVGQVGNAIGAAACTSGGIVGIALGGTPAAVVLGIVGIAVGAAFSVAFIYNAVVPTDREETVPAHSSKVAGDFHACDAAPVSDAHVVALVGSNRVEATTGPNGHATVDLSSVIPTNELLRTPTAHVRRIGGETVDVDLSTSPIVAKWKASLESPRR